MSKIIDYSQEIESTLGDNMNIKISVIFICISLVLTVFPTLGATNFKDCEEKLNTMSINEDTYSYLQFGSPPTTPNISGPSIIGPRVKINYSAVSFDPDGDQIFYMWDWGYGVKSKWLGPYNSSEIATTNHSWDTEGEYSIRVLAKDSNDIEGNWSEPFNITIIKQLDLTNLKHGYIYLRLRYFNQSFLYVPILEILNISIILGSERFYIETDVTENVSSVKFEIYNRFWDIFSYIVDDNASDGFNATFIMESMGILQVNVYAYDREGYMMDLRSVNTLIYIILMSSGE